MPSKLVVIAGPDQGKVYPLSPGGPVLIGRGRTAVVRLADPHASRSHCQVKVEKSGIVVEDLDSASGLFVNEARVRTHTLKVGDVLRVGSTLLRLESEELADQATLALPPPKASAAPVAPRPTPQAPPRQTAAAPAQPALHNLSGQTLSYFQIGPVLVSGKNGVIFRAHDTREDRAVALKVFYPGFSKDEDDLQRFLRAMKTVMPLRHPHLVGVHHAGRVGANCWVAMELVEGVSLVPIVQQAAASVQDWRAAFRVVLHVSRALAYLHGQQIIHRNITPTNVLMDTARGTVKLGDLMTVKAQEGRLSHDVTQAGEILGDMRFLSPEQTANANGGDGRADLYSLGATAYAVLTGRPPLEGANYVETILKIRQTPPLPPRQFQPTISPAFEATVLKLLAKKPEDRFESPGQLLGHLESIAPA